MSNVRHADHYAITPLRGVEDVFVVQDHHIHTDQGRGAGSDDDYTYRLHRRRARAKSQDAIRQAIRHITHATPYAIVITIFRSGSQQCSLLLRRQVLRLRKNAKTAFAGHTPQHHPMIPATARPCLAPHTARW